jgi:uroporphyrinogen decarboxylase
MRLRDRFVQCFQGAPGVRPPFLHVFGPMKQTVQRWLAEGMRDEHEWFGEVGFEGEPGKQFGNRLAVNGFVCPPFKQEVSSDDGRYRVMRNSWGAVVRVPCDGSVMAYLIEGPVKDARSWEAMKERLRPDTPERFPANWSEMKAQFEVADVPSWVGGLPCGFFGAPRELFGLEALLTNFHDQPRLMHDVMDTLCDLWCEVFSRVARETRVDFMFVWEDMCYRNGPLISPRHFREFMLPRYKRLTATLRQAGIPLMLVDTDGNFDQLIPLFIEGGIDFAIPYEVQSGMDIRQIRRDFPTLGICGGVEKSIPTKPAAEQEAELARIAAVLKTGRFLPHSDHGVPPHVPYRQYVDFYRKLGKLVAGS